MSFTYTADLQNSPRDTVRFIVGDRIDAGHLLEDQEIDALLAMNANDTATVSAICAETMAAVLSAREDRTIGDLRIRYSDQAKNLRDLATRLRNQMGIALAAPYAGGISLSDKAIDQLDPDLVQPSFSSGMQENVGPATE